MELHQFIEAAYEAALKTLVWSELIYLPCHENEAEDHEFSKMEGLPFDEFFEWTDVHDHEQSFRKEVADFVESAWMDVQDMDPTDIGHNFVLSKNHHGTGFWDRGWGDRGDRLHNWATTFGDTSLYLSDDMNVYIN